MTIENIHEASKNKIKTQILSQEKIIYLLYTLIFLCIVLIILISYFLFSYLKPNFIYVRNRYNKVQKNLLKTIHSQIIISIIIKTQNEYFNFLIYV